ncbi:MAG: hypothetical protein NVS1B6_19990 [Steroidobacteraceae bacterium]
MKITIESTERVVEVNGGLRARVWDGYTESGIPVHCMVAMIAVHNGHDQTQFERELHVHRMPSGDAVQAFPLRMVL